MPPKKTEAAASKPKSSSGHPTYQDMITDAIVALKDRNGSSRQKLKQYVKTNNNITLSQNMFDSVFNKALKSGVEKGVFQQPKGPSGGTKLAKKTAPAKPAAAKKEAAKPAASTTKKAAPKAAAKPAAKKETAAKPAAKKETAAAKPAAKKAAAPKAAATKAAATKKAAAKPATEKKPAASKTKTGRVTKKPAAAAPKKAAPKAAPKKKKA